MASTARLERLRKLTESDINALPDCTVFSEPEEEFVSDDDSGGVSLEPSVEAETPHVSKESKQPIPEHAHPLPTASEPNTERQFVWLQGQESSYNLGSSPKLSSLPGMKLSPPTLRKGDLVPACDHFTPIFALAKYPYTCVNRDLVQTLATHFWDQGKFWNREWDLYYVWDTDKEKALILVSESQFQDLLKDVNSVLKLSLKITDQQREDSLVTRFFDHPHCRPRYLGRSSSREDFKTMVDHIPGSKFRADGEPIPPPLPDSTREYFREMMEELWALQNGKGKLQKKKKQQERMLKQQSMSNSFKQAQRYLGLRPTAQNGNDPQGQSGMPAAVDIAKPVPFPFDCSVVFVCVDVESDEMAHDRITEIGIATLDTRDLKDVAPGKDGENWRSKVHARHIRIEQYKHIRNHRYLTGCPDRFDFGTSEFVGLKEAAAKVGTCFKPPFSALPEDGNEAYHADLMEQRNLIFLGHDAPSDIRYLEKLGFNPCHLPNLLETHDTATMYRVWKREPNPSSLSRILGDFDIAGYNLHNAGNDAVFTVQSMLAICVREATIRGSSELETMRSEN